MIKLGQFGSQSSTGNFEDQSTKRETVDVEVRGKNEVFFIASGFDDDRDTTVCEISNVIHQKNTNHYSQQVRLTSFKVRSR